MFQNKSTSLNASMPLKKRAIKFISQPIVESGEAQTQSKMEKTRIPFQRQSLSSISSNGDTHSQQELYVEKLSCDFKLNKTIGFCQSSSKKSHKWMSRYLELKQFKNKHGHCNVPQKYSKNLVLGQWVHKQRYDFKNVKVSAKYMKERYQLLLEIGFKFETTYRAEALWQQRYNELRHYKEQTGHCNVPQTYNLNKPLGRWVRRQRHELSKIFENEKSTLTNHRIEALNVIGFKWALKRNKRKVENPSVL